MLTRLPNLDPILVRAQHAFHRLQWSLRYVTGLRVISYDICCEVSTPKSCFQVTHGLHPAAWDECVLP